MKSQDRAYCPFCGMHFSFNVKSIYSVRKFNRHFEKCKKNHKDSPHWLRTKPNLSEQKYYYKWERKEI